MVSKCHNGSKLRQKSPHHGVLQNHTETSSAFVFAFMRTSSTSGMIPTIQWFTCVNQVVPEPGSIALLAIAALAAAWTIRR